MIRSLSLAAAFAIAVSALAPSAAFAAPCKDAKGKFTKCPPIVVTPAKGVRCKDGKGKFAKCGTPGAVPIK